ncbi:MAG: SLC13 family permease [Candidatus Cyclobacteriaceae bacterium M3_2C_046]
MLNSFTPAFVILVIFALFLMIYKDLVRPSHGFLLAILLFTITGILSTSEILSGFANPSIASILLLILITSALRKNFNLELIFDLIFQRAKSYRGFMLRMMTQVALLSSFINNTPVVALMTPYVFDWGKKHDIAPSKLLIPLSYATIMGGMITLIGTSTTLVLNGFLIDFNLPELNPYNLLKVGLVIAFTGILFIALVAHKLLPQNRDTLESYNRNPREYVVETHLTVNSTITNKTIKEAGLRNLKGVYLVEIIRKNRTITPVQPNEVIQPEDILIFAGNTNDIVELVKEGNDICLPDGQEKPNGGRIDVVESVISNNSSLIGKTVKEADFRKRYDAAIIAIHRNGEKLTGKIGQIKLNPGDLLLVYAGADFVNRADLYRDIYVVSKLREIVNPGRKKYYALATMVICAIVLLILGQFSLFASLLIIFSILASFGMITVQDIKRELDLNLIAILVFSLALGQAIIKTGTGDMIGDWMLDLLQPFGNIAVLTGLLILTTLLTSFVTNVGAISIAFPLAFSISNTMQIDGSPFYLALAYAASAAFLTPIGYQTNLIIYGPGSYTFKDFFKIGLPVTILYLTMTIMMVIFLFPDIFL